MKAALYALEIEHALADFIQEPTRSLAERQEALRHALARCVFRHFEEAQELIRRRKINSNYYAQLAVLNEIDDKWRAVVRRLTSLAEAYSVEINPDSFKILVERVAPEAYRAWEASRTQRVDSRSIII